MKRSLGALVAKIAVSKKGSKQLLTKMKQVFSLTDAELSDLYKSLLTSSTSGQKKFFESKVLLSVADKTTMGRRYVLEGLLLKTKGDQLLQTYIKDSYLGDHFYGKELHNDSRILEAFRSLQEIKTSQKVPLEQTDLAICFLEAFDEMLIPLKSAVMLD